MSVKVGNDPARKWTGKRGASHEKVWERGTMRKVVGFGHGRLGSVAWSKFRPSSTCTCVCSRHQLGHVGPSVKRTLRDMPSVVEPHAPFLPLTSAPLLALRCSLLRPHVLPFASPCSYLIASSQEVKYLSLRSGGVLTFGTPFLWLAASSLFHLFLFHLVDFERTNFQNLQ